MTMKSDPLTAHELLSFYKMRHSDDFGLCVT